MTEKYEKPNFRGPIKKTPETDVVDDILTRHGLKPSKFYWDGDILRDMWTGEKVEKGDDDD